MLPALVLVVGVSLYPIAMSLYFSVHETQFLEVGAFNGLGNYISVFSQAAAWKSIWHSLRYVLGSLAIVLPLGLALATVLNQSGGRGRSITRTVVLLPWVISQTVAALLWVWLLNPQLGPINYLTRTLADTTVPFLADPKLAMITLITANVWMTYPLATVLILAALQTVPSELYEAVDIDGGNAVDAFRFVTFPFISTSVASTVIMLTVHYFNMVTLIFIMTGGGPLQMTEVMSLKIYKEAFEYSRLGTSAAFATVAFGLNIAFAVAYGRILRKDF